MMNNGVAPDIEGSISRLNAVKLEPSASNVMAVDQASAAGANAHSEQINNVRTKTTPSNI